MISGRLAPISCLYTKRALTYMSCTGTGRRAVADLTCTMMGCKEGYLNCPWWGVTCT